VEVLGSVVEVGWWIGFNFDLGVGVVCHWVCDVWYWWRVCDLWNWQRLRMIRCSIMVGLIVCQRLGLIVLVSLWWKERRVGWRVLLVVRVPLHGVVDFYRC
jgi:hypothetical protein